MSKKNFPPSRASKPTNKTEKLLHDLGNRLTVIKGNLQLLLLNQGSFSQAARKNLSTMAGEIKRLEKLLAKHKS